MFVLSRDVSAAKRVIATLLATAIVLWASGAWSIVQAANVTDVKDTLSDSAPGAGSNHTIEFVAPSGVAAGEDITVTFPAGFDLATNVVAFGDIDLEIDGVDETLAAASASGVWGVDITGQVLTIDSNDTTIGGTATITIKIGTNADGGANQIINPTPAGDSQSYEIDIAGTMTDSGHTRVAIVSTVEVTASVSTSFVFTVEPNGSGEDVNGDTTTLGSSTTTIPFGNLDAGVPQVISQDLTVTTNAINGFVVTVQSDGTLRSSTGADIDDFVEGSSTNVPTTWASPVTNIAQENTWGHWGITTEDNDAADNMRTTDEFAANEWIGASTTPREVFAHNGPSDGSTPNIGSTTVGFKVEISPLQEAGDDYSTILTYIATPTF